MDILLSVGLAACVIVIIYFQIKRAKKLGGGCGSCGNCSKKDSCPSNRENK